MRKNRGKRYLIFGAVFLALFLALTVGLVCSGFGDYTRARLTTSGWLAQQDGVFCELNEEMLQSFGSNPFWYDLSEILGLVCFVFPLAFAGLGLFQLCKRKSLKKVDADLYFLAGLYAVTGMFYLLFEKVVINYRPVLMDGVLEASYPSSHTLLVCVIVGSAVFFLKCRLRNRWLRLGISVIGFVLIFAVSLGRLFAGVHWSTDVLGGVLLADGLVFLYKGFVLLFYGALRR